MSNIKNQLFIYEDESIEGYMFRSACSNYVTLDKIKEHVSLYFKKGVGDLKSALLLLNEENEFFYSRNSIYYIYHCGLLRYHISQKQKYSKFCPACLLEKSYHRIHWMIAPIIACRKHNLLLINYCASCFQLTTFTDVTINKCSKCKRELSLCKSKCINVMNRDSSMLMFDNIRYESEVWKGLVLTDFYLVLKRLRWFLNYHSKGEIGFTDLTYDEGKDNKFWFIGDENCFRWNILQAYELADDWPNNILKIYCPSDLEVLAGYIMGFGKVNLFFREFIKQIQQ
ncbi:TniQ family protein [Paenibacillus roseipurpureus]|uniref:TniQ family protein n=1 Tax=Paenibacillus roseopurpureus TaxID=2918901 RepID=A0AA96LQI9_9BACL|nr:TniQ family protein [Paenibacillus sp. MBLB1832]WNR43015.1 TniQ family protein [Paenibacillus sp. MBLB1832]